MYFSRERKFLYCHISRTGGTSLFNHFLRHVKDTRGLDIQHLSMSEAKAILGDELESWFTFAFVRNPWERLVSWYGLMANTCTPQTWCNTPQWQPDSPHWQTFDKFLEEICTQTVSDARGERLSYSQWQQITDEHGKLLVDDIGRFENFARDANVLLSKIAVPVSLEQKLNTSRHLHYSEYYSDFGKELVAEVFHEDVHNLNYHYESA